MVKNIFTEDQKLEIMHTLADISILSLDFIERSYRQETSEEILALHKEYLTTLIGHLAECMFDEDEMVELISVIDSSPDRTLNYYKKFMESKLHQIMNGGDK